MSIATMASLFDGIGGFPHSASKYDIKAVWASEIEPNPVKVTKLRFPEMKHYGDVTKVNGAEVEPVDIITFGSPCQDLSVAGKRAGMQHESKGDETTTRSGLFMEAVRIIKEMRDATRRNGSSEPVRPRFAVWENVPGAFSSNSGEDFRIVLEELAKVADRSVSVPQPPKGKWQPAGTIMGDGFSIAWRVVDAQYWGVPQRRRRIYLVADFGGESAPEILFEREGLRRDSSEGREAREGTAADASGCAACAGFNGWKSVSGSIQYGDTCPTIESNMPPNVCIPINDQATHINGGCNGSMVGKPGDPMYSLTVTDNHAVAYSINHQGGNVEQILVNVTGTITAATNSSGNNKLSVALYENYGQANVEVFHRIRSDEYAEVDVMGTMTARQSKDADGLAVYTMSSGQANANVLEETCPPLTCLHEQPILFARDGVAATLMTAMADKWGLEDQHVNQGCPNFVHHGMRVRRLTPNECCLLQGYPYGWAAIPGASDSTQYKEYGNSLAIPNSDYVIEGIAIVIQKGVNP